MCIFPDASFSQWLFLHLFCNLDCKLIFAQGILRGFILG
jgi:hypothetical protein